MFHWTMPRAYAKWAGMRLPSECEWQVAGDTHPKEFVFNEVWEWNESERFDDHNNFVTLRVVAKAGCYKRRAGIFPVYLTTIALGELNRWIHTANTSL